MIRRPAVAGMFYPADAAGVAAQMGQLWPAAGPKPQPALAVVSPHAGWVYSGAVAAKTIARVVVPDQVIVLGPNHRGTGRPAAIMTQGSWSMPDGPVELDAAMGARLLARTKILEEDHRAHAQEHSLEVQLPFLRRRNPGFKLTPIAIARFDLPACRELGLALAEAIKESGRPALLVASTDMTHYEPQESARLKDQQAIDRILELDPEGLYQVVAREGITMCGVIPTVTSLMAALELGATRAELVQYATSGQVNQDFRQVVGYAGLVIS